MAPSPVAWLCILVRDSANAGHHLAAESSRFGELAGLRRIEGGGSGAWPC
jgi:hypothetical protein